jgi:hypothetical protein
VQSGPLERLGGPPQRLQLLEMADRRPPADLDDGRRQRDRRRFEGRAELARHPVLERQVD